MVILKILNLRQSPAPDVVEIDARMDVAEFKQLGGELDNLCIFAVKAITNQASAIQTGARHQFASYLLFPIKLRRQFKTDEFDFRKVTCGAFTRRNKLYVVYEVPQKGLGASFDDESRLSSTTSHPEDRLGSEIQQLKQQFSSTESV